MRMQENKNKVIRNNEQIKCRAGEVVNLKCESNGGNPPAKLKWKVNGIIIQSSKSLISKLKNGNWRTESSITLPISKSDHSTYIVCHVQHKALSFPLLAEAVLNVSFPPIVNSMMMPMTQFTKGDSVSLTCEAVGNPPPVISWRKVSSGQSLINGETLYFARVSLEDAGTYQCQAENELGISQPSLQNIDILCMYKIFKIFTYLDNF